MTGFVFMDTNQVIPHHKLYDSAEKIAEAAKNRHWKDYLTNAYGVPEDLSGLTVLDVGSNCGSLTFEFEARGAKVTAGDMYDPVHNPIHVGGRFLKAKELLKSKVEFLVLNILFLPNTGLPVYDIVFCSDVLHHTMSPLIAVANICGHAKKLVFISIDYHPGSDLPVMFYSPGNRGDFLYPTRQCLINMMADHGCKNIQVVSEDTAPDPFKLVRIKAEKI